MSELPVPMLAPFPKKPSLELPPLTVTRPVKVSIRNINRFVLIPGEDFKYPVTTDQVIIYSKDDDLYFNIKDTTKTDNNFLIPVGTMFSLTPADDSRVLHFRPVSTTTTLYLMEVDFVR